PETLRLMRAWHRTAGLSNVTYGGHRLDGDASVFPQAFILRHYIALSAEYAYRKYADRVFDPHELSRGWHHNETHHRIGLARERFELRPATYIKTLTSWNALDFDRADPARKHYWQWYEDQARRDYGREDET